MGENCGVDVKASKRQHYGDYKACGVAVGGNGLMIAVLYRAPGGFTGCGNLFRRLELRASPCSVHNF